MARSQRSQGTARLNRGRVVFSESFIPADSFREDVIAGLSSSNVSSASDLARLVAAAHEYPLIRQYSTRNSATVQSLGRQLGYRNTNGLVRNVNWEIGLSKTGYISEAGRCLVMRVRLASREVIVVLLDSWGKLSRVGDANRIKKWLETHAAALPRG